MRLTSQALPGLPPRSVALQLSLRPRMAPAAEAEAEAGGAHTAGREGAAGASVCRGRRRRPLRLADRKASGAPRVVRCSLQAWGHISKRAPGSVRSERSVRLPESRLRRRPCVLLLPHLWLCAAEAASQPEN